MPRPTALDRLLPGVPLSDDVRGPLAALWRDGFVRLDRIFGDDDIARFRRESERLLAGIRPWAERHSHHARTEYLLPAFGDADWAVLMNLAGRSADVDDLLERLFTHPRIRATLTAILGEDYKAWEISLRRSNARDGGLRLHEDATGELGLAMLLADHPDRVGTTVFLRGSHRLPVSCREAGAEFIPPARLGAITRPATGRAGDIFLFFKKTWHGRVAGVNPSQSDALLLALFPVGYEFVPFDTPPEVLGRLGPELARLLDPHRQLRPTRDGRAVVTDRHGASDYAGPPRLVDHLYRPRARWHPGRAAAAIGATLRLAHRVIRHGR
jgi:putative 2OG-Fe(II) oxygenase